MKRFVNIALALVSLFAGGGHVANFREADNTYAFFGSLILMTLCSAALWAFVNLAHKNVWPWDAWK